MKLHDPVRIISLCSTIRLIGIVRWLDVRNDESVSFYMSVTLSLFVPSIMIDEFPLNLLLQLVFLYILLFYKNGNLGKCFRNICIKIPYFI